MTVHIGFLIKYHTQKICKNSFRISKGVDLLAVFGVASPGGRPVNGSAALTFLLLLLHACLDGLAIADMMKNTEY
jgi:hypothetical protein